MPNLYQAWLDAKQAEKAATAKRIDIEEQILINHPPKEEGTYTFDEDGYSVKIKQDIVRKLDEKRWSIIRDSIPEQLRPVQYVEKPVIEANGLRWLRENEPGYYKIVATAITEKSSKPNIQIERN